MGPPADPPEYDVNQKHHDARVPQQMKWSSDAERQSAADADRQPRAQSLAKECGTK